ncbi:hypothetical protein GOV08_05355 [Candidatus Woesearchaeota archaeon]|nr:hypothetical protein [Candidatus Woesearchaeota archaeon]
MKQILCPRCKNMSLVLIDDGIYRCHGCGYTGTAEFEQEIFKKGEK